MKWSAWILPVVTGVTLSLVYLLPSAGEIGESAVKMNLPGVMSGWSFKSIPPSQEELGTLTPDTEFAKAICLKPRPGEISIEGSLIPDRADLSVVLSGHDLNNSIHRPERCMPAQGHNITSSKDVLFKLANGREFEAKRLGSTQRVRIGENGEESVSFDSLTYYFFIGHDRISNDHLERTLIDMKDRLLRGMDQRWAYVSVSMWYGKLPWIEKEVSEEEADAKLQAFLRQFAEDQIDWKQVK
ncbi:MAG: exosortase-associated EpsI family protein [Verrucomicrobiales bacterium]